MIVDASKIDFNEYIDVVGELEAQEIHSAGYWRDELHALADCDDITGEKLPWGSTYDTVRLRGSELSIWAGISGHRKSFVTGQIMLWLSRHSKVAIASLEMKPAQTLMRMLKQASGTVNPSHDYIDWFEDFADENILIYDQLDTVKSEKILGVVNYSAKVLGCKHIVIDSLQKCGIRNDIDAESEFINRLQFAAKNLNIHVHLVHHVRKPPNSDKYHRPSKFDVKGSSSLTDMCDNVFIVWKNIKREEEVYKREAGYGFDQEFLDKSCDQLILVEKQRHGEFEGAIRLYVHPSGQICSQEGRAMPFELKHEDST